MYNYFSNKTKAEVLSDLSKKKLQFKIPTTLFFNVNEWNSHKEIILKKIIKTFKNKKKKYVAVRSSAIEEDTEHVSNAGKFTSELNVKIEKNDLIKSINKTIKNYKKIGKKNYF